jgi:hypothetical protein
VPSAARPGSADQCAPASQSLRLRSKSTVHGQDPRAGGGEVPSHSQCSRSRVVSCRVVSCCVLPACLRCPALPGPGRVCAGAAVSPACRLFWCRGACSQSQRPAPSSQQPSSQQPSSPAGPWLSRCRWGKGPHRCFPPSTCSTSPTHALRGIAPCSPARPPTSHLSPPTSHLHPSPSRSHIRYPPCCRPSFAARRRSLSLCPALPSIAILAILCPCRPLVGRASPHPCSVCTCRPVLRLTHPRLSTPVHAYPRPALDALAASPPRRLAASPPRPAPSRHCALPTALHRPRHSIRLKRLQTTPRRAEDGPVQRPDAPLLGGLR